MAIAESGEMYLETILVLSREKDMVRSIDICNHMGFSKPSVSRAVGILKKEEYILVSDDGSITLTDAGKALAEKIYDRHKVMTSVLLSLGVSSETAIEDACKMEHVLSDETFEAIKKYLNEKETAG